MAGSPGLVNWKIVAAELDRVPQDFKDPKFYALKHVVEILTSSNPQGMVGQLRDQEQRLVTLVDQMVQGYHSGFAKSIQNYSQILQLFGDAKEQVDGLKKALADASRQLSAQSRTLQQQWRKTLALECSLGLLDDIQLVADAPGRIDEALAAKDWSAAVQLLLEACSKLATEELAKVGALRKLRQDMLAISLAIQVQLLEELHSKVYASSSTALQQQQQQQQYNSKAVQPYSPHQQRSQTPPRGMNSPRGPGSPLRSMSSPRGSPRVPGSPGVNFPGSAAGQSVMDELKAQQQRGLSRLSAAAGGSSPNLSASVMPAFVVEALQDAPSSSSSRQQQHDQQQQQQQQGPRAANVAELVGCLQQLDALEDAKVYLLLQARAGIRRMVLEVVEAWAAQEEAQQQQQQQGAAGKGWSGRAVMMPHTHAFGTATAAGSIGSSSSKQSWAVQQSVQLSAQRLLSAVFDACLRALSNLGGLLHDIAEASSSSSGGSSRDSRKSRLSKPAAAAAAAAGSVQPPAAGGLKLLKQQLQQQGGGGTSLLAAAGGSSSNLAAEYAAAAAGSSSSIGVHSELLPASSAAAGSFIGGLGGGLNRMINSSGNLLALAGAPGGLAGAAAGGLGAVPGSGVLETKDPVEYLRVQYGHVWNEIQEEALLLLAELLRASLSSGSAAAAPQSGGARQGGWLADFAELGEKARGQLLQATSSTSLAASQVLSSLSSTSSSSALGMGGPAAAAAAGSSGSSVPGMQGFNPGASGALNLAGGFGGSGLGSKLSFSFELTAAELVPALTAGPGAASAAAAAAAAGGGLTSGGGAGSGGGGGAAAAAGVLSVGPGKESVTYAALVKRGLGSGSAGGPYLTPAVFLGVSNFVSDALIVISDASLLALPPPPQQQQQQQQKPAAGAAAAGGSGFGVQHQQAEAQQGLVLSDPRLNSTWLRQSVEEWVVEGFLPQVWVDLRGRCTAALEDPEAFRPQQAAGTTGLLSSSSNAAAAAAGSSEAAVAHRPAAAAAAGAAAAAALPQPPRCVVAAASFAVQVLQEVMAWLPAMPVTAAATLSGVLDAILSQVLEAMTAQAAACLAGTKAGRLALLPQLSLLMATEPDALLLPHEDPVAFYVPPAAGGYGDSGSGLGFGCWSHAGGFDCSGFQAALKSAEKPYLVPGFFRPQLKVRGFGLEGEASAEEALLFTLRERPGGPDQLLVGSRPAALVQLAALAESCDWVADCLRSMAAAAAGGQLAAGSWLGRRKAAAAGRSKHTAAAGGSPGSSSSSRAGGGSARGAAAAAEEAAAVAGVLQQLADRYRSFAGACSRALRLDLLLMAARQLYALSAVSHICEEDDVMEAHPSIGGLARLAARAAEDLAPHLSSSKMNYVFGPIPGAAARYLMWVLEDIGEMNAMGVERMIRSLALLQGHLCGPGALLPGTNSSPSPAGGAAEVSRAYDRAKQYYTLVGLPAEEVVRLAGDRPGRFSVAEWQALLLVHVPGRTADERQLAALHRALDKHYHLSAGQKVAEFFEGVVTSVQAPVQNFTGNVSAGFKGSFSQAKALLNKAAASVSEAATSVGAAAAAAATKGKTGNEK